MQAADLQSPGVMHVADDIGNLKDGWDDLGFAALFQDNEGIGWQPAVQHASTSDLLPVTPHLKAKKFAKHSAVASSKGQ